VSLPSPPFRASFPAAAVSTLLRALPVKLSI